RHRPVRARISRGLAWRARLRRPRRDRWPILFSALVRRGASRRTRRGRASARARLTRGRAHAAELERSLLQSVPVACPARPVLRTPGTRAQHASRRRRAPRPPSPLTCESRPTSAATRAAWSNDHQYELESEKSRRSGCGAIGSGLPGAYRCYELAVDGVVSARAGVPGEPGCPSETRLHAPAVERAQDRCGHVLGRERVEVLGC